VLRSASRAQRPHRASSIATGLGSPARNTRADVASVGAESPWSGAAQQWQGQPAEPAAMQTDAVDASSSPMELPPELFDPGMAQARASLLAFWWFWKLGAVTGASTSCKERRCGMDNTQS
jgi:hypothetical protein